MKRRDRYVVWLANRILRFASPRYRLLLRGSILYGLGAAKRDAEQGKGLKDG